MVLGRIFKRRAEPDLQLEHGLEKTRRGVFSEISRLFDRESIDEELYEDLEMLLIQADVGWDVTQQLIESMRRKVDEGRIVDPGYAREILRWDMVEILEEATRHRQVKILQRGVPYVIMVVGVNGVGKTTSIAKLAAYHQSFGAFGHAGCGRHLPRGRDRPAQDLGRSARRACRRARAGAPIRAP